MQIVINTIEGTFVVPKEREADLIYWLKHNANRIDGGSVWEQRNQTVPSPGRQLLNENGDLV
jgi:hypothetical protein